MQSASAHLAEQSKAGRLAGRLRTLPQLLHAALDGARHAALPVVRVQVPQLSGLCPLVRLRCCMSRSAVRAGRSCAS